MQFYIWNSYNQNLIYITEVPTYSYVYLYSIRIRKLYKTLALAISYTNCNSLFIF